MYLSEYREVIERVVQETHFILSINGWNINNTLLRYYGVSVWKMALIYRVDGVLGLHEKDWVGRTKHSQHAIRGWGLPILSHCLPGAKMLIATFQRHRESRRPEGKGPLDLLS